MVQLDQGETCKMIYLASPYSHPDPAVRDQRYHQACRAVVHLLRNNQIAFSPVIHSHPLVAFDLPSDWSFWQQMDRAHLQRCDEVVVLMLEGWRESIGVAAEIRIAEELGKPVGYLSPNEVAASTPNATKIIAIA